MARMSDTKREFTALDPIAQSVREYKRLRAEITKMTADQKKIRDTLMAAIEQYGEEDDTKSLILTLPTEVDGTDFIKRQRRVSRSLDDAAAEEILTNAGIWENCTKTVIVVDEDAVMQALYDDELSEDDVDAIYPSKVTWALEVK